MLSEQDQEFLEAYLDDALSSEEADRITARLEREPALVAELATLREQRRGRKAVWESLEPTEDQAGEFAVSVIRGVHRRRMMARMSWAGRLSGAAAACILVGLGSGWYMWGRGSAAANPSAGIATVSSNTTPTVTSPGMSLASNNQNGQNSPDGQIQFVGQPAGGLPAGTYQVELTDDTGSVLAVQKFNKLDEAQHFAQDLGQVVERQQNVQNGHVTLVSDHF